MFRRKHYLPFSAYMNLQTAMIAKCLCDWWGEGNGILLTQTAQPDSAPGHGRLWHHQDSNLQFPNNSEQVHWWIIAINHNVPCAASRHDFLHRGTRSKNIFVNGIWVWFKISFYTQQGYLIENTRLVVRYPDRRIMKPFPVSATPQAAATAG